MKRFLFGLRRAAKVERLDVPGGSNSASDESVSGAGGQRSGREAHNLTAEGSTPSPATTSLDSLWPSGLKAGFAPPVERQLVLGLPFFLHVHNILDEAEAQMRAGEAVDLDEIALLLSSHVRENLAVVYAPLPEGR